MHEILETVHKLQNLERETLYWQDERERLHETFACYRRYRHFELEAPDRENLL